MKENDAIEVLTKHQKWRLGCDKTPATEPTELTAAIDTAIKALQEKAVDVDETVKNLVKNWGGNGIESRSHTEAYEEGVKDAIDHLASQGYLRTPDTIPEGYVLVPIEPTEEMLKKGYMWRNTGDEEKDQAAMKQSIYKAMIKAAQEGEL